MVMRDRMGQTRYFFLKMGIFKDFWGNSNVNNYWKGIWVISFQITQGWSASCLRFCSYSLFKYFYAHKKTIIGSFSPQFDSVWEKLPIENCWKEWQP